MKTNWVETAVGAVVILIAAVFLSFAYTTSGIGKGSGGYQLVAEFDNADGIGIGSDVRMSGIKIGTVTSQTLDPTTYQAVLNLSIDRTVTFPDDTSAKVTSEGLLGSKFIALEPGGSEAKLNDGDRIAYTQGAIDIWSLVSQFMFDSKGANEPETGDVPE
ncbi:MAG TPA: outer membrane lipid asymmetry maintenance protein MlaD [Aestuariivirgaceae bacterium]|jgi:phospholipid/cholesterol/gamma-HCH transport system substrate-binding protein|nr:outer membrane lipid asymmetry maintenance protein MlaD [Aestuariivirgaceae bacterium]